MLKSKHLFTLASVAMFVFVLLVGIRIYLAGGADRRDRAYWKKLDRILSDAKFEGSYLLARDGKIIASGGRGTVSTDNQMPIGRDSTVAINSLTKQFTGVAIYQLLNEGKLRLDAPIGTYLPDCPYGSQVTVQQLLEMKSGLPNFSDEQSLRDKYGDQIYSGMDQAALRADVFALQLKTTPGETFEYSNTNYYLLGLIIEQLSGEKYEDYIQKNLIQAVGMRHTGFNWNDAEVRPFDPQKNGDGREFAPAFTFSAGEMTSTVVDLYLWQNYLYGGGFSGIVPQDLFKENGYHMGLNRKDGVFRHAGATHLYRSNMLYDTNTKEQVILLGRRPESDLNELTDALKEWLTHEEASRQ